jgi:hypothetical protein
VVYSGRHHLVPQTRARVSPRTDRTGASGQLRLVTATKDRYRHARCAVLVHVFMISRYFSTLRSQVGFAAAVAHARLRLSRLELIGGSGCTAGRYASAARAFISPINSPTAFESRRGEALLWDSGRRQGRVRRVRPLLSPP